MGSILGTDEYIPTAYHDKDTPPKAFMHIHVILLGIRYYSCEDMLCREMERHTHVS